MFWINAEVRNSIKNKTVCKSLFPLANGMQNTKFKNHVNNLFNHKIYFQQMNI